MLLEHEFICLRCMHVRSLAHFRAGRPLELTHVVGTNIIRQSIPPARILHRVCLSVKLIRQLDATGAAYRAGSVAIGNFDGVHLGHARIIERLLESARRVGGPAVVFTFDPHPVRLLRPAEAPPPLTWTDRKAALLTRLGVDVVIAYPTDDELLTLEPRAFFDRIVLEKLDARALVEGTNFYFGHNRAGNVRLLRQFTESAGISLDVVEPVIIDGEAVSSSRVRKLIAAGRIDEASRQLTEPYRIRGLVVHGAGRGARLGFATANLDGVDTLVPGPGVYAGRACIAAGSFAAAINIGANPTFGEHAHKIEVHLVSWTEPLYGQVVEVDFLSRLRDIQQFASIDDLKQQLQEDSERALRIEREMAT